MLRALIAPSPTTAASLVIGKEIARRLAENRWVAQNAEFVRGARAGSTVTFLPNGLAVVIRYGAGGHPEDVILVDPARGLVKHRLQAEPPERTFAHLVPKGEPLFAMRTREGRGVILKFLPSGRTWWRFSTGRLPSEPTMIDGLVLAPDEGGTLWALNVRGEQRVAWTYQIGAPWRSAPEVVDGTVYLGANDGRIYAIEAAGGRLKWSSALSGGEPRAYQLFSRAAVSGGRVYIRAADGTLSAIEASTGKVCWQAAVGDWIRALRWMNMRCTRVLGTAITMRSIAMTVMCCGHGHLQAGLIKRADARIPALPPWWVIK